MKKKMIIILAGMFLMAWGIGVAITLHKTNSPAPANQSVLEKSTSSPFITPQPTVMESESGPSGTYIPLPPRAAHPEGDKANE